MAKAFARAFYKSKAWHALRDIVIAEQYGMCKKCGMSTRLEVHHRIRLTPENITNPDIALNREHLVGLCYDCHMKADEHDYNKKINTSEGLEFDEDGELIENGTV